jgi:hypothetical protein
MKTHAELAHLLLPTTPASMDDKWRAAWRLLDEDPTTPEEFRCHARCWLTYRAIEGHVTHADYLGRVALKPCSLPPDHDRFLRWTTSLATADFYYWTLWGDLENAETHGKAIVFCASDDLKKYPPALLSWLRVKCVLIYADFLDGEHEDAKLSIQITLETWQQVITTCDFLKHPLRFMDAKGDSVALHAIMCIASRLGLVPSWMQAHEKAIQDLKDPWVKCLKKLSQRKGAIWV